MIVNKELSPLMQLSYLLRKVADEMLNNEYSAQEIDEVWKLVSKAPRLTDIPRPSS